MTPQEELENRGYDVSPSFRGGGFVATNGEHTYSAVSLETLLSIVKDCNNHDDRETLETLEDGTAMVQCRQCGDRWEEAAE